MLKNEQTKIQTQKSVYYIILCYRSNNVYNHREKNVQNDQEERTVFNFEMLIVKKLHKNLSLKGPTQINVSDISSTCFVFFFFFFSCRYLYPLP